MIYTPHISIIITHTLLFVFVLVRSFYHNHHHDDHDDDDDDDDDDDF